MKVILSSPGSYLLQNCLYNSHMDQEDGLKHGIEMAVKLGPNVNTYWFSTMLVCTSLFHIPLHNCCMYVILCIISFIVTFIVLVLFECFVYSFPIYCVPLCVTLHIRTRSIFKLETSGPELRLLRVWRFSLCPRGPTLGFSSFIPPSKNIAVRGLANECICMIVLWYKRIKTRWDVL